MIDINTVTYEGLLAGKYKKELPELYRLKTVVEHNLPYHNMHAVFDHTLDVFKSSQGLLTLYFVKDSARKKAIKKELNSMVGEYSRKELTLQSALLHDMAKSSTIKKKPDGKIVCPKHDEEGAKMIDSFRERFGWTKADMEFVRSMVKNHLVVTDLVDEAWRNPESKKEIYAKIKEVTGGVYLEEMFLAWADTAGLHLKKYDPEYFRHRESVCREMILNEIKI